MIEPEYTLSELISKLQNIKENGDGQISFCRALMTLSKEIENINKSLDAYIQDYHND